MSDFKMSERKLWKVAVIGCGAFANWEYLPNIRSEANADIVAAVDIIPERAQKACEDYNISNWYKSVFELIENCDFDIAIDAASIQAHHEINMAVLSAGKHLITQKPAAPSVELLNEQIALADKNNVKMVCVPIHPMRYDLNIAKQMIKDNAIGTPYYAKCNLSHGGPEYFQYRNADPTFFFEPGAGALVDMGVHGLQIVTSVFGAVKKIMCMAKVTTPERIVRSGAYNGKVIKADKIPDQYIISLDFGGNKMALVDTGFSQKASKAPQLEIFGDKGTISFTKPYMQNPIPDVYMDCPEKGIRGWVNPMEWENPPQKLNSQCCCLKDLIDAIENNKKPLLSAEHARHILEIMCKIPEAAESGKTIELETSF